MTYLEEYARKVLSGEIVACHRIKQVYRLLLDKLLQPEKYDPWVFNEKLTEKPIDFIETFCKQAQGKMGTPIKLELFQKAKLQAIFGFVHKETRFRQYNECLTIEGRKNGKSSECAAVNLYLLMADGEGAPEIYNIATMLDQAKIGFEYSYKMVKQSPMLRKHIRKRISDLYFPHNMGIIKPLASNSNSLDGLNAHGVTIDELSAIKNRDIYDLMKQSMSARQQPLLFCITTNGFVRDGIFDAQYDYACNVLDGKVEDDRFLPFIYELDSKDEWDKEECWIKANPGLGTIKSIQFLRECVAKAKNDPAFKPTVMVKDFNMKENSSSAWLTWDEIDSQEEFDFRGMGFRYGVGGFDASETTDLTAAKVLCMRPGDNKIYVKSMYWIPEEVLRQMDADGNRRERDNVPYLLWEKQGLLRTTPGNKIDKHCILEWFMELRDKDDVYVPWIGYDPWHIEDALLNEFIAEFGRESMIKIRQGVQTLSYPMKSLKGDLAAKKIVFNKNPIDMWNLSNLEIRTDINGNIQPVKGKDNRKRIDGAMALIDAYIVLHDKMDEYSNLI
ncbi:terminase large subunit [Anaeroselena agilis]|uniref:Terminase large subunit n=1 Tax=Anaeroselena agilis TaxID=3063788 RepID=A0ABU3NU95_9FIRM|nr:terminase large subunit [Selenomonadales bacterium 4137-cl]